MAAAVPAAAATPNSAAARYAPISGSRFPISSSIKRINTTRSSHSLSISTSLSNPQTAPPPPALPAAGEVLSGAEILVHALERQGVTAVFAYPGGASVEIHQALSRSPTIRTVLPRHEQGGVFAAEGYARAAGRPGVCIATSGPGATNLVTGLADAYLDSIPVVAITGQVPRRKIGTDAFQETPTVEMTRSITKHNYIVLDVDEIPRIVKEAFFLASSGRPGPVLIDIPKDIQQQTVAAPNWDPPMRLAAYTSRLPENPPSEPELEQIVRLIYESRKPVLYIGGGCVSSGEELRAFVELTRIPVATTLMGLGVFPANHELSLQMLGIHGCNHANYAVQNCDLLLAFGVRFDDRATGKIESFAKKAKIVHIDIDSAEIGKVKQPHVSICGDVKVALKGISNLIINNSGNIDFRAWREELNEQKAKPTWSPLPLTSCEFDSIRPDYVIKVLDELTNGDAVITTGVGLHQMWAAQFYGFKRPRQWLTSGGFGAMGFGLPAAIGAAVANTNTGGSIIVDIDGDGSFMMNMQELATVKVEDLPIKMVILNNQHLGMVVQWEDQFCEGNRAQSYLGDACSGIYPNLLKASEAFGIPAARVTRNKDVRAAIRTMLETPGPYLLDVIVAHHQHVFPLLPNR